jgi:diguanylate cyclase (GGDEF)-like protein
MQDSNFVEAAARMVSVMRGQAATLALMSALVLSGTGSGFAQDTCPTPAQREALLQTAAGAAEASREVRRQHWERLIAAQRACKDAEGEAAALAAWGDQSMHLFEREQALDSESARYALSARAGLTRQRADAAARLGKLLTELGQMDLAELRMREASATFEQLQLWAEAAEVQSRLSRFNRLAGDYLTALTDEQAALAMRRHIDPPPNVWRSLLNLAILYEQLELPDDARRRYTEALDEAEREGNQTSVAVVLSAYSGFLNDFGANDASQALALAQRARNFAQAAGEQVQLASALLQIGRARMNLRHFDEAGQAFAEAMGIAQKVAHLPMQAHILFRYGELALAQGDARLALERIDAARLIYESQGNRHRLAKVHAALELVYQQLGDGLNAARAGRERFRLRDELMGANANGKLGELLSRFELTEERRRSERLQQEKALAELRLAAERQQLQITYLVAAAIGVALLLLGWRYLTANRLYRLLRDRNTLVNAQAEQLSAANLRLTEQSQHLYQASITDALTGIRNRAHGMQRLKELLTIASTGGGDTAVLLIDVDHFKAINDTHGHPVGDQVLIRIAQALQQGLPAAAELSRVGGEEFMVLLPAASNESALMLANTLREKVRAATLDLGVRDDGVSISIGIASAGADSAISVQALYAAADAALYRAKQAGRDCVFVAAQFGRSPAHTEDPRRMPDLGGAAPA